MSERTEVSFDAALMMALRADAQKELDELATPAQLKERYPDTSRWDARLKAALHKRRPVLKRVLVAAMTLVILTLGALAVSADFRKAVYTMIQKFLPIEMQLTYQVDGEPLERLPDGYSDHYVPDGFEMDDAQKFERAENFLHVYSSKETEESYTVRCSIIQPGQQSLFDNEHTVYETVKVGEADGVLGTSTDEHGKNVYTLSWEYQGITHTVMGNIRDNRHYYEVHMSSQVFDSYYYYTYHTFQIKPSGNSEWWTHNVTHQSADHKTIVADSMNYSYPVGSEPKNPTVSVKASFSIKNYGSFTLKAVTLSRPESL